MEMPENLIEKVIWDRHITNDTLRECIAHQKICFATRKYSANDRISREEWEDNMQRSREENKMDKKRDDIFKQIFN